MDYREEQFLRMQQSDTPKVPFYMSYPMQNLYLTEMEYEKDMDRMKELYPRDVSRIMDVIEERITAASSIRRFRQRLRRIS